MPGASTEVVVAGHICLDIFPTLAENTAGDKVLMSGKLVDVGPATFSLGGAVANTGLALHRLGVSTRLMGKVGNDLFGRVILDLVRGYGDALAEGMLVAAGEQSSYSIVISPPGVDRTFLLQGLSPEEVLTSAVAVGASSVEQADAISGVPSWSQVQARVDAGWARYPVTLSLAGWQNDTQQYIWRGRMIQSRRERRS